MQSLSCHCNLRDLKILDLGALKCFWNAPGLFWRNSEYSLCADIEKMGQWRIARDQDVPESRLKGKTDRYFVWQDEIECFHLRAWEDIGCGCCNPISSATVRHRLRRGGYRACRPVRKPVPSEQHRQVCNWNKPSLFIAIHWWYILYYYVSLQLYIYSFNYFGHVSSGPGRWCGTTCGIGAASTSRTSHRLSWERLMDWWGYGGDETRPTTQTASYQRDDQVESLFRSGDVSRMTASSLCCACKVAWLASATGMRCWLQLSIPI